MASFDWHVSPADRFAFESQFDSIADSDALDLDRLRPVFAASRLPDSDFSTICRLIDIRSELRLNKCQFVYFMHIIASRRRGRPIPLGLPLNIKEEFLKEPIDTANNVYVRREVNVRDVGASAHKDTHELEAELAHLELDLRATQRERDLARERSEDLRKACVEINGIASFTSRHEAALEKDVAALRDSSSKLTGATSGPPALDATRTRDHMSKLAADKLLLERIARDLRLELDPSTPTLAAQ